MLEDPPTLEILGLTAGYGGQPTVRDVSMRARAGKIVAILGPNGAGKSTFLKSIVGAIQPISGRVILAGRDVGGLAMHQLARLGIVYVPQVENVFTTLSVRENLEMGAYSNGRRLKERLTLVCELFPDLVGALGRPAWTLSGGQRNMLALGRGMMVDPTVLLLDEPTAGLAPRYELAVWQQVVTVSRAGVAVVIVEQNTRQALNHANYAYVLVLGRVELEGTAAELMDNGSVAELYLGGSL
jgi:ABC-type branched-subunit amino acid transport system ATPase component